MGQRYRNNLLLVRNFILVFESDRGHNQISTRIFLDCNLFWNDSFLKFAHFDLFEKYRKKIYIQFWKKIIWKIQL